MKIYTKTGDKGTTELIGGIRIDKSDAQLECYGTIDELNAVTGVAIEAVKMLAATKDEEEERDNIVLILSNIQNQLFALGSILATEVGKWEEYWKQDKFSAWTGEMEEAIDRYTAELPPWRGFILPGGSMAAAQLHVCRTVCRRAEREMCRFSQKIEVIAPVFKHVLIFANRLSDFYFILSRKVLQIENKNEITWKSGK
ncbi:MAG: cob(I)yrinic acid a,c-diamide adenosyltransferase [Bacteroidales bacterium]|nr:cob(I)yrinic acid a,c-diamide adenosyltransferase [Bacteroidales bacterium]